MGRGMRGLAAAVALASVLGAGACGHGGTPTPSGAHPTIVVHVPPSYAPAAPAPLLVMLHGYGSSAAMEEAYLHLTTVADAHGMLYVRPEGTRDSTGARFWNATDACCDMDGSHPDDSAYLSGVIRQVEARYAVDRRRVFVVGHSNGGFMAYRLACDHADQVAAVVSLEAATFTSASACRPSAPVAILEIHGTADPVVPYRGGTMQGHAYPGAPATVALWAGYDGCAPAVDTPAPASHAIVAGLPAATVTSYSSGCRANGHVELWTQPGGHHKPALDSGFAAQVVAYLLAHPKPAAP